MKGDPPLKNLTSVVSIDASPPSKSSKSSKPSKDTSPSSKLKAPSNGSNLFTYDKTLDEKEGAKQFKMHMDAMIQKNCDDLRQSLEFLYLEYLDFVEVRAEVAKREGSGDGTNVESKAEPKDIHGLLQILDAQPAEDNAVPLKSKSKHSVLPHHDSSFEDHLENEKAALVGKALQTAEALHAKQGFQHKSGGKPQHHVWWETIYDMHVRDIFLEPSMGLMIILNIAFMGVVMDTPESALTLVVEVLFCIFFAIEFIWKLVADGCKKHFFGEHGKFHWFCGSLVVFDLVGIFLSLDRAVQKTLQPDGTPSASLLRASRIMRLTRVLRMLKWQVFSDLCAMMQGVLSGMPTLLWSMVLFFCPIYVFALLFREALGRGDNIHGVTEMFDSVPRSIYTTFRCSFGDCSHPSGVPIFEYVQDHYGWVWSTIYCMFAFFFTIGLFNVISAIFVEATMKSAADLELKTKKDRLQSADLWSVQVEALLRRLVRRYPPEPKLLFTCTWDEHISGEEDASVIEKVQKARIDRDNDRKSRGLGEMPDDEWNERFSMTDKNGEPLYPSVLVLPAIPEEYFPITAKLNAPKAFRALSEEDIQALDDTDIKLSEEFAGISKLAYGASAIDAWVKDPLVSHALDELDIDPQDHDKLSDILDPQNDGCVPVLDLIDGIRRLRGFPRRSDIVTIDLMIRQSQLAMHEHKDNIENVQKGTEELSEQIDEVTNALGRIEALLNRPR